MVATVTSRNKLFSLQETLGDGNAFPQNAAAGNQRQRMERARQRAIADFSALLRQGYLSAQSMVESLQSASLPVDDGHLAASHAPDDPTRVPALAALAA